MQIHLLADRPEHVDTVTGWVHTEWQVETRLSLESTRMRLLNRDECPRALVAVAESAPVGVLGFRRFRRGVDDHRSLFVDVVYVEKSARGRGVGTALLERGIASAKALVTDLYVFTEVPGWYEHRGWEVVQIRKDGKGTVLVRRV